MEKIKKTKPPFNYESDFILRILAIIIAVIIWVVLSITQYPTTTLKISGVPVVFNLEGSVAQEKGLRAVGYDDITTVVEIRGMKYEIGGYTEKDLIASVNLDDVTKEGTYNLEIIAKSNHSSDQCEILSCYPKNVKVTFEHYSEQTFDVETEAPYINTEDGTMIKKTSVSPEQVTITASDTNLSKVKKVCAKINDSKTLVEDTTISTTDLVLYDENNNVLPEENYTIDQKNFDILFSIYKEKIVDLAVDFKDCPNGFNTATLPYKLSQNKIKILSPNTGTNKSKTIGTISLSEINLEKSFIFDIPFDKNEENLSKFNKAIVAFDSTGYSKKELKIENNKINIINKPSGKKVSITTTEDFNATILGPDSIIENLESEDLIAEVDLKDINKTGTVTKSVIIYSKKYNNIWCYGTYDIQISVSD